MAISITADYLRDYSMAKKIYLCENGLLLKIVFVIKENFVFHRKLNDFFNYV